MCGRFISSRHHRTSRRMDHRSTSFSSGVSLKFYARYPGQSHQRLQRQLYQFCVVAPITIAGFRCKLDIYDAGVPNLYPFSRSSPNILALWSYNWLTLSGTPPYLMLPSTGWDKTFNTGRGYIQGRFRSNNMLDAEAEYRDSADEKWFIRNGGLYKLRKLFANIIRGSSEFPHLRAGWVFG